MANPSAEMSSVVHTVRSHTRNVAGEAAKQVHPHPELVVFAISGAVLSDSCCARKDTKRMSIILPSTRIAASATR